jgi:HlyD family secretion protein
MLGRWKLAIAAGVVLVCGVGGFLVFRRSPSTHAKVAPASLPAAPKASEITLTGTVQAAHVVDVPVPVDGTVEQFLAEVGQRVSEGEVLARIKNPRLGAAQQLAKLNAEQAQNRLNQLESDLIAARLEVSRSEADATRVKMALDQSEKTFERQQTMFREGVAPRLAYEKAEQEYKGWQAEAQKLAETARSAADRVESTTKDIEPARKAIAQRTNELEDAEAEMAAGEVNALADGVVIARRGKVGQPVTTAISDLFRIAADPQVLQVVVAAASTAARIQPGQSATIELGRGVSPLAGTVREVKSGQVFLDIANPPPAVAPGMSVQVKIRLP